MATGNTHEVEMADGRRVFYSYGVPVAVHTPGVGYEAREQRFSVTTSKHVNGWAGRDARKLTEAAFRAAIAPLALKG